MAAGELCILCPGQGAQAVGMGQDYYGAFPAARSVFDRASAILGWDVAAVCFGGPEQKLNQTDVSQPAIYVTSVACWHAAVEARAIDPAAVGAMAGLSLGEYTALHLAGALTFEQGLQLVAHRGRYMQEAASGTPSGMVCILGADEAAAEGLCRQCAQGQVLVAANFNCPGQIVLSGAAEACDRAARAAKEAGFGAVPLKVAGAFHSPLMEPARQRMAALLQKAELAAPRTAVWANVTAQPHGDAPSIRRLLVDQIVKPVRWSQTMAALAADAATEFVELAPGRVLSGLLKKIDRRRAVLNLGQASALEPTSSPRRLPDRSSRAL